MNEDFLGEIEEFYEKPIVGKKLPNFELEVFHKESTKKIKFSDYVGKWIVLVFYPADFTFICPTELAAIGELYPEFQKVGAEVFGVSTDTVFSHKAWHDTSEMIKKINFPMLADLTGKLCKALRTYLSQEGLSLRATVIADPEGIIKAMDIHDNSIGRSSDEILRKLQAAIFVRQHKTQVCPVNWHPGSKTLKPGLKLVGKL
ncbi:MAG: redoxin domain-containing protein [Candidatus Moraniibacteriota bacterium]